MKLYKNDNRLSDSIRLRLEKMTDDDIDDIIYDQVWERVWERNWFRIYLRVQDKINFQG